MFSRAFRQSSGFHLSAGYTTNRGWPLLQRLYSVLKCRFLDTFFDAVVAFEA